jgi:hypothetical protein
LGLIDATSGTAGLFKNNKMVFTEYNEKEELIPINYSFEKGYGIPCWIIENKKPYITNDAARTLNLSPRILFNNSLRLLKWIVRYILYKLG